jgi:hypothetical protein
MSATGLSFDVKQFRRIMAEKKKRISAASFRPQFEKFVSESLTLAAQNCPTRALDLIQSAQQKQYQNRIDYIPSIHWADADPRLVAKGEALWAFSGGKWYNATAWKLPPLVYSQFMELNAERERRMQTERGEFITNRAQARWLYVKQFWRIAKALGLRITCAAEAIASHTRRKPPKEPPAPNAQWRGGKHVLSVAITAPFLSTETAYWTGNGLDILKDASDSLRPTFKRAVMDEVIKRISV